MAGVSTFFKVIFGAENDRFNKDVKQSEKAMKDFSDNSNDAISNLSDAIGVDFDRIKGSIGTFTKTLSSVGTAFTAAQKSGNGTVGMLRLLKVALISTGIGALVVALGALVAYFTQSERGANKLSTMMAGLGAVVKVLTDKAVALGEYIVAAFENPKKAVSDLWNAIRDNIVNRFTGILDLFSAVGDGIKAIFDADWDALKRSATDALQSIVQINTGLDKNQQKAFIDSIAGMANEMANEAKQAADLKAKLNALERAERDMTVTSKQREAAIKALKYISEDVTKSDQARIEATQKAIGIQRAMLADEKNIASQRVAILTEQMKLGENTRDDYEALANAKVALADVDARIIDQMIEMNNKLNQLNTEIINRRKEQDKYLQLLNNPEMKRGQYGVNITMGVDTKKLATMKNDLVAITEEVKGVMIDLSSTVNDALASIGSGFAEAIGQMMAGSGDMNTIGNMLLSTLGGIFVQIGNIIMKAGIAFFAIGEAFQKALVTPAAALAAVAAGAALVAVGSAMQSSVSAAASGGSGSSSSGVTNGSVRSVTAADTNNEIKVSGEFKIKGNTLVAAVENENKRKSITS
jgi:hypothetical protein